MPRTRSLAWSELKIGIVAVAALALATMFIIAVGGQGGFSWNQYELKTKFSNVKGLKTGAVVRVAGVEVGKVSAVELTGSEVEVRVKVHEDNRSRITTDSRASIGSLSLLGEPVIDISPATTGTPLNDGDFLQSSRSTGELADVAEGATQSLEQVTGILRDLRAGKGTIGRLFTDEQVYREVNDLIASAGTVARQLGQGRGTLGMLIRDPAAYNRFNAALADLQATTRRINAGEGSLGRLLKDDALAKSLTSASANFDQVSARLNRNDNTMGRLLTERELYDKFNAMTGRIDTLMASLQKGEGSAGRLLNDKELYENMNAAASELRQLIGDIRKDPRKYLNVRVSIF
jgi:phospholipid/cholesterol/gamma-HCH transport system substrate-binding protein